MARPKKCRQVARMPRVRYFKPRGIPLGELTEVYLSIEGAEALRLVDTEGLDLNTAARQMNVSRHTLGRILAQARRVVSQAITEGMAIRIEGGDFIVKGASAEEQKTEHTGPDHRSGTSRNEAPAQKGERTMQKIAVSSEGPSLDDQVDPRFGRAGGFLLVDPDTMETLYIDNGASQTLGQGAGIQAAENVARAGATVVLSGYVGPKAFQALTAAGIKVGQDCDNMTVREVIEKWTKGEIPIANKPNR
ncbi:DUF134 domain-containing protein [Desulfolithobacter sp.]